MEMNVKSNTASDWKKLQEKLKDMCGEEPDLEAILFLIGVQELGKGYQTFKKDDKVNLLHIAICTVLEPYGFYKFKGRDADGWPHFDVLEKLPVLSAAQQNNLMVGAVVEYFKTQGLLDAAL